MSEVNLEQAKHVAEESEDRSLILRLVAQIESMQRLDKINSAFYDVVTKERDAERTRADLLTIEVARLKKVLNTLLEEQS